MTPSVSRIEDFDRLASAIRHLSSNHDLTSTLVNLLKRANQAVGCGQSALFVCSGSHSETLELHSSVGFDTDEEARLLEVIQHDPRVSLALKNEGPPHLLGLPRSDANNISSSLQQPTSPTLPRPPTLPAPAPHQTQPTAVEREREEIREPGNLLVLTPVLNLQKRALGLLAHCYPEPSPTKDQANKAHSPRPDRLEQSQLFAYLIALALQGQGCAAKAARQAEEYRLLYQREQQARTAAEETACQLSRLRQLSAALSRALSLEQVGSVFASHTLQATGADTLLVMLVGEDEQQLELVVSEGCSDEAKNHYSALPPDEQLRLLQLAHHNDPLWIQSPQELQAKHPLLPTLHRLEATSLAIFPCQLEGRLLGVIKLAFHEEHAFDRKEQRFLCSLMAQCAQAFERARLYRAEQREHRRVEEAKQRLLLLAQISEALGLNQPRNKLIATFRELVCQDFATSCQVDHRPANSPKQLDLMERETAQDQRLIREIAFDGRSHGWLILDRAAPRPFSVDDQTLASELAARLAMALENRQLLDESREIERHTRKQAVLLRRLSEASRAFASAGVELHDVQQSICEWVIRGFGDACEIRLLSDDQQELHLGAWLHQNHRLRNQISRQINCSPVSATSGLLSRVINSKRPLLVPYIRTPRQMNELAPSLRELTSNHPISSALVVPLIREKQVLGTLATFRHNAKKPFTRSEQMYLEELSQRAVLGIENARLFRDTRRAISLRDEFLSIAGHELRTPLTSLQLQVQSMSEMLDKPQRLTASLGVVSRQVSRLTFLVRNLLDVSRVTSGGVVLSPRALELRDLLVQVIEQFQHEALRAGCDIELNAPEEVHGYLDPLRLEQVLTNLLSNAVRYGAGKPIQIRLHKEGERARIMVKDSGIGIENGDKKRIFDRFERAAPLEHFGGLGLGLWITQGIVAAFEGSISVCSEPGKGSTFTVEFPLGRLPEDRESQDLTASSDLPPSKLSQLRPTAPARPKQVESRENKRRSLASLFFSNRYF